MNSFGIVFVLATIAAANAGFVSPFAPVAAPYAAYAGAHFAHPYAAGLVVPRGSGLEGQYVPDHLEKLYDDGSYKPELQAVPLSASPYGLVPSGSGLEGQYVHDLTEKLFDDGSYRPEHHY